MDGKSDYYDDKYIRLEILVGKVGGMGFGR
jgi:hypothetical protein